MDYAKEALKKHKEWKGKLEVVNKMDIASHDDLSIAYTPGVAAPCLAIKDDPKQVYTYTGKGNTVAVISDGSAVLGLGNIGPEAGMPVMEGKCVLFKALGGIDAVPLCLNTQNVDELVQIIAALEPSFGGINLEDIAAPRCFEVEERLKKIMNIPVFHDDQHGTAIVVCSALLNALRLTKKKEPVIVVNGAGSAGIAIATLILDMGLGNVILVDRQGILRPDMDLTSGQRKLIDRVNLTGRQGTLADALKGADVLIGVSAPHIVSQDMIPFHGAGSDRCSRWPSPVPESSGPTRWRRGPKSSGQAEATTRIKSTTCWRSRAFSRGRWTRRRPRSTTR